jgi:hypothetical protein
MTLRGLITLRALRHEPLMTLRALRARCEPLMTLRGLMTLRALKALRALTQRHH